MTRYLAVAAALAIALAAGGAALGAGSKCDSALTKAAAKKVACKCGVIASAQAKGSSPDSAKLQKCTDKFTAACSKAKGKGDCSVQNGPCSKKESEADSDVTQLCQGSPSGAFLE